ncbi:MAG: bifunctional oligoribonuclease/PAP phosphatase NrnA [Oscillospiraceae bacterium]|jgi:phosphoesterase RecJ-like protein|nr:bifunctional oligoribonuclease/PAP phosphatase NrnA [Oscillospiraceae bacterium]
MANNDQEAMDSIVKKLRESDYIHIITHQSPDPDTLGSGLALCFALQGLGKTVKLVYDARFAQKNRFLFDGYVDSDFPAQVLVTVDIAAPHLFPEAVPQDLNIDICIDHHMHNEIMATWKLVKPSAAATGEIVYDLIQHLGATISPQIAKCLYTAIATDTYCFRQESTTARSHQLAAELIRAGIDHTDINHRMFASESLKDFELKKMFFASVEFFYGGRAAIVAITEEMLQKAGLEQEQLDNTLYSELIKIEGVQLSAVLREQDKLVKISIRTNKPYNANDIAKQLHNGGGHKRAAGCSTPGPIAAAKLALINKLGEILT